jgi:hypothetical protein
MSRRDQPIAFFWLSVDVVDQHGVLTKCLAMVPQPRYVNVAKRQFGEAGSEHVLDPTSERSMASHNAYFAQLKEYFDNLPETYSPRYPTPEHFRKWLLVQTNWFDESEFNLSSEEAAKALGDFIRRRDAYAWMHPYGKKLIVRSPRSQSRAAMGKEDFEKSKHDVLELAAQMVGVAPGQMAKEARRHG